MGERLPLRAPAAKVALEIILDASLRLDHSFSDMNIAIREDIGEMEQRGNLESHYGTCMVGFWFSQLIATVALESTLKRLRSTDYHHL